MAGRLANSSRTSSRFSTRLMEESQTRSQPHSEATNGLFVQAGIADFLAGGGFTVAGEDNLLTFKAPKTQRFYVQGLKTDKDDRKPMLSQPGQSILPSPSAKSKHFHKSTERADRYQKGR